jgi:hypothetical protein
MQETHSSARHRPQIDVMIDPPLPRWPTWSYICELAGFYAAFAIVFSVLGTTILVMWARPFLGLGFVSGVMVGLAFRRAYRSGFFARVAHRFIPWQHVS